MMDSVEHTVDFILVVNDVGFKADILKDFPRMFKEAPFSHPQMGCLLMVSPDWSTRVIWGVFSGTYKEIQFSDCIEEAEDIIRATRVDLPDAHAV